MVVCRSCILLTFTSFTYHRVHVEFSSTLILCLFDTCMDSTRLVSAYLDSCVITFSIGESAVFLDLCFSDSLTQLLTTVQLAFNQFFGSDIVGFWTLSSLEFYKFPFFFQCLALSGPCFSLSDNLSSKLKLCLTVRLGEISFFLLRISAV